MKAVFEKLTPCLRPQTREQSAAAPGVLAAQQPTAHDTLAQAPAGPATATESPVLAALAPPGAASAETVERRVARLEGLHNPGVVGVPRWQDRHGGDARQYATGFWRAAVEAQGLLRQGPSVSADAVFDLLAAHRGRMAQRAGTRDAESFGKRIPVGKDGVVTYITGAYREFPEAAQLADSVGAWRRARLRCQDYALPAHVQEHPDDDLCWVVRAPMQDGSQTPLLELAMRPTGNSLTACWLHATPSQAGTAEIEALFQQAISRAPEHGSRDARIAHVCQRMGRLHWWLSHQCLFERGSAAITDMLAAAVLLHHGFAYPGWRSGVSADVRALCCFDQGRFARDYSSLLRGALLDAV